VTCHQLDELIEAIADGDRPPAEGEAHMATCPACRASLALARALDRTLVAREVPVPPPGFTARVMQRVGQERWRAEQIVDIGFNIAVTIGVGLIALGGLALAYSFGWLTVDRPTIEALGTAVQPWLSRLADDLRTVMLAALLLSSALAVWWWVEDESPL
jgi:predicted anti-sigma-YlaC factor YlaD